MNSIKIIIQIIDDDPIIPDLIKDLFKEDNNYSVTSFSNPADFYSAFNKNVDLVITDIRIPGYDVMSTIKTIAKINPSCYIIVISAYFDVDILKQFIECRVDAVVEKKPNLDWFQELMNKVEMLRPKLENKPRINNDNG